MQFLKINNPIITSVMAAVVASAVLMISFMAFEPTVGRAAQSVFTVTQTITSELSVVVASSALTLSPSLQGITGGTSTAQTDITVTSNNSTGYTMDIKFSDAVAMQAETSADVIRNYSSTSAEYNFIGSTSAQFGYSALSSTTPGSIDLTFKDNGSACGVGSNSTGGKCWIAGKTTDERIFDHTSDASSGVVMTLQFNVNVPDSPSPGLPNDTYRATATVTTTLQ